MKIQKRASGESVKMTKSEWLRIGRRAGWTKTAGKCAEEVLRIAEKHGADPSEIKKELKAGAKVEAEHKGVYELFQELLGDVEIPICEEEFFKRIALAHLDEMPDYYTQLKKMEEGD